MKFTIKLLMILAFTGTFLSGCDKDSVEDTEPPGIQILSPTADEELPANQARVQFVLTENDQLHEFTVRVVNDDTDETVFEWQEHEHGQLLEVDTLVDLKNEQHAHFMLTIIATDHNGNERSESVFFHSEYRNDNGILALNFQLQYDGVPLVMYEEYPYPNDSFKVFFSGFSFYISNVRLLRNEVETSLLEIDRLRLERDHDTLEKAQQGTTLQLNDVPMGTYQKLAFDIGIPTELNAKEPKDFPADHPLAATSEYWTAWKSYIHCRTEGKADPDGDGRYDVSLALHLGSDALRRSFVFDRNIGILPMHETELSFIIDLKNYFTNSSGGIYDLMDTPQIHSLSQMDMATQLADNLAEAIK